MVSTHSGPYSFGPFIQGEHQLLAETLAPSMHEFNTNTLFLIGCDTSEDFGLNVQKILLDQYEINADVRIMDKRLLGIDINTETLFLGITNTNGMAKIESKHDPNIFKYFGVDELRKFTRSVSRDGDLIQRT